MKQLPIPVLKACPCVGASLYSLCVLSGFGGRAGSEVSVGCFSPGLRWRLPPWLGVWLEPEGLKWETDESWGFSQAQWCSLLCHGVGPRSQELEAQSGSSSASPRHDGGCCLGWGQCQNLSGWNRSPGGAWLLLSLIAVFAFARGGAVAPRTGAGAQ